MSSHSISSASATAVASAVAAIVASGVVAYGMTSGDDQAAEPPATPSAQVTSAAPESVPTESEAAPSADPANGTNDTSGWGSESGSSSGGQEGGGQGGGDDDGGEEPEPAGPQIATFAVAQEPACPAGTNLNPIPGQPLELEWLVTGADEVTLSVDGPGAYGTYPADSAEVADPPQFTFACAGDEGDIEQHTYLITATVDGQTVTEELVVEAEVHEITQVPDGEGTSDS